MESLVVDDITTEPYGFFSFSMKSVIKDNIEKSRYLKELKPIEIFPYIDELIEKVKILQPNIWEASTADLIEHLHKNRGYITYQRPVIQNGFYSSYPPKTQIKLFKLEKYWQ